MKKFILIIAITITSILSAQNIIIDCIHGADFVYNLDDYMQTEIDFQNIFQNYEVEILNQDDIQFTEILINQTQVSTQQLQFDIDLPEELPGNIQTLYVVVENSNTQNCSGNITDPQGNIVELMFNNTIHFDNAYGANWLVNITIPENEIVNIKIGYGLPLFETQISEGIINLDQFESIIRIYDTTYLAINGQALTYSLYELEALQNHFLNGNGMINAVNTFDGMMDKPFIHFRTDKNIDIDLELKFDAEYTYVSPKPQSNTIDCLKWENFELLSNNDNEILYEAKMNNKLNFLNFFIQNDFIEIKNQTDSEINNLILLKYIGSNKYQFSDFTDFSKHEKKNIRFDRTISASELLHLIQSKFRDDALENGLTNIEAEHFVYDYQWIQTLLNRAYHDKNILYGFYNFGNELYDKLIPLQCNPQPENSQRNMWVLLSNIQNNDCNEIIDFIESADNPTNQTEPFSLIEYGVIDEYYSQNRNSREFDFFDVQTHEYINGWMLGNLDFYANETAQLLAENVTYLNFGIGQYSFIIENPSENGIYHGNDLDYPFGIRKEIEEGKLIILGTSSFFDNSTSNIHFLNNCMNYICDNSSQFDEDIEFTGSSILGNYPNPFNPKTEIAFNLENDANVSLKIYNIKGQLIKMYTQNEYSKGIHKITWNGKNSENKNISAGIYFYRITINNEEQIRKMLLLK